MVKQFILIISTLFLFSCGARKVDVSKTNIETKVDSSVVIKVDGTYVKDNNIFVIDSTEEVEYRPLDSLKPMIIEGKQYTNTVIKSKKHKSTKTDKSKVLYKKSSVKKLNVKREDKKDILDKHIKKDTNYWMYLWLLVPVVIIWILEKYGKLIFPFFSFLK